MIRASALLLLKVCGVLVLVFTAFNLSLHSQDSYILYQCFECHSTIGAPGRPGSAAIGGMAKKDIVAKLEAYRSQYINDSVMTRGSHDLSDEDIELVAEYFSRIYISD
jgi:cytochrome c553